MVTFIGFTGYDNRIVCVTWLQCNGYFSQTRFGMGRGVNVRPVELAARRNQLGWLEHAPRMDQAGPPKRILIGDLPGRNVW